MDEIFRYQKSSEDDYYAILGCSELATVEQINAEYRARALLLHPDKDPDNQRALQQFQKLQEAKEVLSDPELRKDYDKWRSSGIAMPYAKWKSLRGNSHTVFHWATPKTNGHMLEAGSEKGTAYSPPSRNRTSNNSNENVIWLGRTDLDLLRKFRSYQI